LALPTLTLSSGPPIACNGTGRTSVVMIGCGNSTPNGKESWGVEAVINPVPLPASVWLMLSGLAGLGHEGAPARDRPILTPRCDWD